MAAVLARKVHPAADAFPMLTDDELDHLAADIAANGLRNPIVLDGEGRILDGRNRLEACRRAGVEPTFTTYDGDAAQFVISANVHRRHLTTGQRAMITAEVLVATGKRRDGRWVRGAVPTANGEISNSAWSKAMAMAGELLDLDPSQAAAVKSGTHSLSYAILVARSVPEEEARLRDGAAAAALNIADGDAAHAQRLVDAYVNARRFGQLVTMVDVADHLEYYEMTPKQRLADRRAQRKRQQAEAEAEKAARLADWEALSDDDKLAVVEYKRALADRSHLALKRSLAGPIDPEAEIRDIVSAVNATLGQIEVALRRLRVHTGLPEPEMRAELGAKLIERKMPPAAIDLLWVLIDDEVTP